MIVVVSFQKTAHLSLLRELEEKRKMDACLESDIPEVGFVSYVRGRLVAMAFLRRAEGGVGIFDSLITDPDLDSSARHEAIESLTDKIIQEAPKYHIRRILAFSIDTGIQMRALERGFVEIPHEIFALELPKKEERL